jgi:hypothetical protein
MKTRNTDLFLNNTLFIRNRNKSETMKRDRKAYTNHPHKRCPFSAPELRFVGYHLFGDFLCYPNTDRPSERLILRYRLENPDSTLARVKIRRELQLIKALIEEGSTDPDYVYEYQGLILDAEYEEVCPDSNEGEIRSIRKIRILDGNSIADDELQDIFAMEYDLMVDQIMV